MKFCEYELKTLCGPKHREIGDIQELVNKHGKVKGISLCKLKDRANSFSVSVHTESDKFISYKKSINTGLYGFELAYALAVELICKSYGIELGSKNHKYLLSLIENYK